MVMSGFYERFSQWVIDFSDMVCGLPEFLLLIGGGLFLFFYSRGV